MYFVTPWKWTRFRAWHTLKNLCSELTHMEAIKKPSETLLPYKGTGIWQHSKRTGPSFPGTDMHKTDIYLCWIAVNWGKSDEYRQ